MKGGPHRATRLSASTVCWRRTPLGEAKSCRGQGQRQCPRRGATLRRGQGRDPPVDPKRRRPSLASIRPGPGPTLASRRPADGDAPTSPRERVAPATQSLADVLNQPTHHADLGGVHYERRSPPRHPLTRFHGVLAPHARWRPTVVPRPPAEPRSCAGKAASDTPSPADTTPSSARPKKRVTAEAKA